MSAALEAVAIPEAGPPDEITYERYLKETENSIFSNRITVTEKGALCERR